jgi:hypothetical protein
MKTLMRLNYNKLDANAKVDFVEAVRALKAETKPGDTIAACNELGL